MDSPTRKTLWAVACAAIVLGAAILAYVMQARPAYSERAAIDSIITSFLAVKSVAEDGAVNGTISVDPDVLNSKWRNLKSDHNVSTAVFSKNGTAVFVSENLQRVVVITAVADAEYSWHCSIIPAVSFDTLCSRFPIKIEGKH